MLALPFHISHHKFLQRGKASAYREYRATQHGGAVSRWIAVSRADIIVQVDRHRRTLEAVFAEPVRASIVWTDIESMLRAYGAELSEGRGSRIRIVLNGVRAVFHRPHPRKETDKGAVRSMRRFLSEAGVTP